MYGRIYLNAVRALIDRISVEVIGRESKKDNIHISTEYRYDRQDFFNSGFIKFSHDRYVG